MLTAAVSGEIFASPSVAAVLAGIRAVTGPAGCLLIVKNYTGDRLNFGLAAERARAEGLAVEMVIVADDIALPDTRRSRAASPARCSSTRSPATWPKPVRRSPRSPPPPAPPPATSARSASSLSSCAIPGQAAEARMGDDEAELGLGIHGEPGVERIDLTDDRRHRRDHGRPARRHPAGPAAPTRR